MDTVIARSASHLWTLFRTEEGVPILNLQENRDDPSSTISIRLDEEDVREAVVRSNLVQIDGLIERGIHVVPSLSTPPLRRCNPLPA